MTDVLRERLISAVRAAGREVDLNAINALLPVVEQEIARRVASCGCPDADATYAQMEQHLTQRAEQAEATLQAEREAWRRDVDEMRAAKREVVRQGADALDRAERAEAELEENTGVLQALRRQRDAAEAAIERVRAAAEIHRLAHPAGVGGCAACHMIAALDQPETKDR